MPRFLKIGGTVACFQASGNTPVVTDRLNRCVIEGQMIGAHSRRTRLVMRGVHRCFGDGEVLEGA